MFARHIILTGPLLSFNALEKGTSLSLSPHGKANALPAPLGAARGPYVGTPQPLGLLYPDAGY
jgi:hypothetical protein